MERVLKQHFIIWHFKPVVVSPRWTPYALAGEMASVTFSISHALYFLSGAPARSVHTWKGRLDAVKEGFSLPRAAVAVTLAGGLSPVLAFKISPGE